MHLWHDISRKCYNRRSSLDVWNVSSSLLALSKRTSLLWFDSRSKFERSIWHRKLHCVSYIRFPICYIVFNFTINITHSTEYDDEPIITKPDDIAGMRYSDYLNSIEWTDDLKNRLQQELLGPHQSRCKGAFVPVQYPEIKQEYVEENVCAGGDISHANFVQTISLSGFLILAVKLLYT